jgi:hypothetical protein
MNDTKINLTLNLVNGILQYMGTRPYAEVFAIVQEIQKQAVPQVPAPQGAEEPQLAGLND